MKATGKAIHFEIFVVVIALFAVSLIVNDGDDLKYYAYAKYVNTQTQSVTNNCAENVNCAVNSPQTQGDGVASTSLSLQISNPELQGLQGLQGPP